MPGPLLIGETEYLTPAGAQIITRNDGSVEINSSAAGVLINGLPVSTITFAGAWSNVTAYTIGQIVTYLGVAYIAIQAGTNHIPSSSPTFWTPLVSGGALVPTGGTTGQSLTKNSNTDGDTGWSTVPPAIADQRISGNISGGSAQPVGLTQAQVRTFLGLATIATTGSGGDLSTGSVTLPKLAAQADQTIVGNVSGGSASPIALTATQVRTMLGLAAIATSGSGADLANGTVTLGKLATEADQTVLGNISGGAASPVALTKTQLTALINPFTNTLAGDVPASGGGTTKFLRADQSWQVPPGNPDGVTFNVDDQAGHYLYIETDNTAIPSTPGYTVWIQGLDGQFIGWGVGGEINVTALGPIDLQSGVGGDIALTAGLDIIVGAGGGGIVDLTTPSGGEIIVNDTGAVTVLNAFGDGFLLKATGEVGLGIAGKKIGFFGENAALQGTVNGATVLLTSVVTQFNALLQALGDNSGYGLIHTDQ